MGKHLQAGDSLIEGVLILAVLLIIIFIMPKNAPLVILNPVNSSNSSGSARSGGEKTATATNSPYAQTISLGTGNAPYAYQPYEEYITISNTGREPVNITNWRLKNAKDKRAYDFGGDLRYFPADTATIGQAVAFISPGGFNRFQNIVLQPNDTAIVTTGKVGSQLPYNIVSFKENICSGYLEDLPAYAFTPSLTRNCPRPADEPGVDALDTGCRQYIEGMWSCHMPEFNTRNSEGDICQNCADGKLLSSSCVAFIKNHFNYSSCLTNHAGDSNFSGHTWRIFLGQGWEMWANRYETIKLFDGLGRLVNDMSY